MERREVLRFALRTGAILTLTPLAGLEPAEAASKTAVFFSGSASGGAQDGWRLYLGSTGTAVRGLLLDPGAITGGPVNALRIRGTVRRNVYSLSFYALSDLRFQHPVASASLTLQGSTLAGAISGQSGVTLTATRVTLSPGKMKQAAGRWQGSINLKQPTTPNDIAANGLLAAKSNGTFQVTKINDERDSPTIIPVKTKVAGRWGITENNQIWAIFLLPDLSALRDPNDPSSQRFAEIQVLQVQTSQAPANQPHQDPFLACIADNCPLFADCIGS